MFRWRWLPLTHDSNASMAAVGGFGFLILPELVILRGFAVAPNLWLFVFTLSVLSVPGTSRAPLLALLLPKGPLVAGSNIHTWSA